MANSFKVGDRIRCIRSEEKYEPQVGEEFIITCISKTNPCLGFVSKYPLITIPYFEPVIQGKEAHWWIWNFQLVERAEDISFNDQMKEIVNESI